MTSSTSQFIGLEELEPEPCDGTGEDVMSTRVRRKWLKGKTSSVPLDEPDSVLRQKSFFKIPLLHHLSFFAQTLKPDPKNTKNLNSRCKPVTSVKTLVEPH